MKINCSKCNKQLTQDLYQVPYKYFNKEYGVSKRVWDRIEYTGTDGYYDKEYRFKRGIFIINPKERKYSWTYKDCNGVDSKREYIEEYGSDGGQHYHRVLGGNPQVIICSGESVLEGVIPKFKEGYGCCNYSMGHILTCSCGNTVGHMYLDCYESNTIHFIEKKIMRTYK
ncbi:hypothetical protein VPLG_00065 [Vibrio phage eugene 12A10]|uniref:hypothetical protein n=1 Tax=Vibrio phage eugene 12A10 TaxID=573172 RepID=UPI0003517E0C|nr:hypothetical protein VPLG_00065 [Vibrio phage eugene 12A10]AGN51504.1 hypothetical protein VPLG_00065 [Vibrio phage eugene 12A10]